MGTPQAETQGERRSAEKEPFLDGNSLVIVETKDGKQVAFGKGDFVTFPKGLSCVWDIKEPVKKHYRFK